jgi:micrococcal nuclease
MSLMFSLLLFFSCLTLEEFSDQVDLQYQAWCASSRTERVERVYDGDTAFLVGVEDGIRFLGVSAPEVASGGNEADCFGDESGAFLRELIDGEDIILEFDVECEDLYSRELAWVFLEGDDAGIADIMMQYDLDGLAEDGSYRVLINELLIRTGYARLFQGEIAKNVRYTDRLEEAEEEAEADSLGLWSACQ